MTRMKIAKTLATKTDEFSEKFQTAFDPVYSSKRP